MSLNIKHELAVELIEKMRGRGHLANHARELRKSGGFCVIRNEVSYPVLVDIAKWLTVELMGGDTLTTATAYWLIPDMVKWIDIVERAYSAAFALTEYNLYAFTNADRVKEDGGIEKIDGLRPLAIIPMVNELATNYPIGTASVLNLNFYQDTRDRMSALFVMDGDTYDIASRVVGEKTGQPIWRNADYAITSQRK